jgi:hypothetical protein
MINPRFQWTRARIWLLLVLAISLLAGCGRGPDPAARPRMDRLDLVTDADVIVHCSNTSALLAAVGQSPLGRFWASPEMVAFRDGRNLPEEIRQALVDENEGENGAKIRDIYLEEMKMLGGEVVVGLDFTDFKEEPAITIVAAMQEEDHQRSLEMDDLLAELEDVETIKASEDFRGTTLYTYIRKEDRGDRFFYQAFYEGTLLASENRPWLEGALLQLMETPAREPEGDPVLAVTAKARLMDKLQSLLADRATAEESPVDPQTVIKSLGLDALGDMDFNFRMKEDRLEVRFQVARRGEWNRGLLVLIPPEPAPLDFRLAYVPRDVASYQVSRLDLNAFWTQIPEILRQISPEFQLQFNMGVNAAGGLMNINVNEDIFNNLDRLAFTYACLADDGQRFLYGLKVKDAAAMERTLHKLFAEQSPIVAQLGEFYHETDVQGHVIHMLQFPMPAAQGDVPVFSEVGLTVVDRALIIGQGSLLVDYVQAAVHNQGSPAFYEQPNFKTMAARIPSGACSYGMSDLSAYARFYVNQIRRAAEQARAARPTSADAGGHGSGTPAPLASFLQEFDVAKLPPADVIADYFGPSEGYSVLDAKGFQSLWTIHYPSP